MSHRPQTRSSRRKHGEHGAGGFFGRAFPKKNSVTSVLSPWPPWCLSSSDLGDERFSHPPRSQRLGRLRRLRVEELAEEGTPALLDHSEHLLQLRVGLRDPELRRQGNPRRSEDRRQPAASWQPGPDLRQGRRHAQSARRSRSHSLPAQARWRARRRRMGARLLGRRPRGHRRTDAPGHPRESPARAHVPRRTAGRRRLCEPRASVLGCRWAQQPHQRVFFVVTPRPLSLDRRRSAVAGSCECEDDSAAVLAPRVGPLFQSARATHHRRQDAWRETDRHRSAPVQHVGQSRPLVASQPRHRSRAVSRDRTAARADAAIQSRIRAEVGQLGGLPARPAGPICRRRTRRSKKRSSRSTRPSRSSMPKRKPVSRRPRSSRPRTPSRPPARPFQRMVGAPRRPGTSGVGRSPARSICSSS